MLPRTLMHRAAQLWPQSIAAICNDESRTYAALEERSNRLANALLAHGLSPGDRVATWMENSVRCIETDFALAKAGIVRVSLNPKLSAREAEYILADSDARALIHDAAFDAVIAQALPQLPLLATRIRIPAGGADAGSLTGNVRNYEAFLESGTAAVPATTFDPEHLYCLFYTSGTTGKPKGVMLSHRSILNVAYNLLSETGPMQVGERILLMQPLTHGAGFFVLPYAMKGGTVVIMPQFDPDEVIRLAAKHAVETIKLVPTMLQRILRIPGLDKVRLPRLRSIIYGASPMPTEPLKQAVRIFGTRLVQIYGQSECPATLCILTADEHRLDSPTPERLSSVGRAWNTVEIRIVDEAGNDVPAGSMGEVVLRGPHLMSGYWKLPELTAETIRQGWLHTKDMGQCDAAGFVYLLGRKDEMIISGGYNIAPREIEEVLYEHAGVQEAAVIGEADAEWGQAVVAYAVLKDAACDPQDILRHARDVLGFKRPKRLYLLDELPKNTTGKIQKKALNPGLARRTIELKDTAA